MRAAGRTYMLDRSEQCGPASLMAFLSAHLPLGKDWIDTSLALTALSNFSLCARYVLPPLAWDGQG